MPKDWRNGDLIQNFDGNAFSRATTKNSESLTEISKDLISPLFALPFLELELMELSRAKCI